MCCAPRSRSFEVASKTFFISASFPGSCLPSSWSHRSSFRLKSKYLSPAYGELVVALNHGAAWRIVAVLGQLDRDWLAIFGRGTAEPGTSSCPELVQRFSPELHDGRRCPPASGALDAPGFAGQLDDQRDVTSTCQTSKACFQTPFSPNASPWSAPMMSAVSLHHG